MAGTGDRPPFEILEHTADIGLRVRGSTLGELFENAVDGLLEIVGARTDEGREDRVVEVEMDEGDPARALVDLLNEVIYLIDHSRARVAGVRVERSGQRLRARVAWDPSADPPDGTELKAATFHQLSVQERGGHLEATVYFDV